MLAGFYLDGRPRCFISDLVKLRIPAKYKELQGRPGAMLMQLFLPDLDRRKTVKIRKTPAELLRARCIK